MVKARYEKQRAATASFPQSLDTWDELVYTTCVVLQNPNCFFLDAEMEQLQ